MPALGAQHLKKSFGTHVVLEDATFTLARGERVALIGANGAGKLTFAKILAGVETADGGTVSVRRGLSIRYVAQEPELDPKRSAREVVEDALTAWRTATTRHAEVSALLGGGPRDDVDALLEEQAALGDAIHRLGGWERGHEAMGFLQQLGVRDFDRPCGERSGGERRRIALAQLLVASPDIAILDEPTNHLDAATAEWLEEHLAHTYEGALVLVTHDRYFLDAIAQRIIELERGSLTSYAGTYSDYVEKKAEMIAHEDRTEQNRQNILRREREWLSRGPKARTTKQKARINRAHALEAEGAANAGRPGEVTLATAATTRQGKTILEFHGVSVAIGSENPRTLNAPFDLTMTLTDRIGIVGQNGVGKTTLVRAILAAVEEARTGERPSDAPTVVGGKIVCGKNTKVAYLDQARARLDDTKSIFDDVRGESGSTVINLGVKGMEALDLRSYLELFLFDPQKQRQKVGALSGGERARVALAKTLREGANLLIFDEPTNDLDLPTLAALEEMLDGYPGSVLVVTHDRAFLDRVATAILSFEADPNGGPATVERHAGGYEDYVSHKREERDRQREQASNAKAKERAKSIPPPAAQAAKPKPPKSTLTYAERIELDGIMGAIEVAEKTVETLQAEIVDPALYATGAQALSAVQKKLDAARREAARLVARWEALETKKGSA